MTLTELAELIDRVDQKKKGCSVNLTTINMPVHGAIPYGIVTVGMKGYQQVFHSEEELRAILERAAR